MADLGSINTRRLHTTAIRKAFTSTDYVRRAESYFNLGSFSSRRVETVVTITTFVDRIVFEGAPLPTEAAGDYPVRIAMTRLQVIEPNEVDEIVVPALYVVPEDCTLHLRYWRFWNDTGTPRTVQMYAGPDAPDVEDLFLIYQNTLADDEVDVSPDPFFLPLGPGEIIRAGQTTIGSEGLQAILAGVLTRKEVETP